MIVAKVQAAGLILVLLGGCKPAPDRAAPDLAPLASQPMPVQAKKPPQASVQRGNCVTEGAITLSGTLVREVRLGAPGYGENPSTDERDTIAVLQLQRELALCRDSVPGQPADAPLRGRRITLRNVPESVLRLTGGRVTVYGVLAEASFAFEHGPVVIWVDSIPALRERARERLSRVSPNESLQLTSARAAEVIGVSAYRDASALKQVSRILGGSLAAELRR
jgi:hypothetical protein